MGYTIGQIAKITGLSTYTLRYYDKEGLFPRLNKSTSGIRVFTDDDLAWIRVLECLKDTGLQLKDVKHYIDLAQRGNETLMERMQIFLKQREVLKSEMKRIQQNMKKIEFKIKYYKLALKVGEENVYKDNPKFKKEREKVFK